MLSKVFENSYLQNWNTKTENMKSNLQAKLSEQQGGWDGP